ncbi:MAG: NUDIX domain-containing protein [Gammaproteobacteria bacterium]
MCGLSAREIGDLPVFAGGIVRTSEGDLLCQLRDNKPGIVNPGCWCVSPGGAVLEGESPEFALQRELMEEFRVEVHLREKLLQCTEPQGAYRGVYHVFVADLLTPREKVECHEGIGVGFFRPHAALAFRQHPVATRAIQHYLAKYHGD